MPKIRFGDIDIYCEVHGEGTPLVFIHGLGSSTADWEFQVPAFYQDYRVIIFDLRGHGQSDKPTGSYSIPMFAADSIGLLKALGVESAHVVGVSLGGAIAFQLALDAPEMVKTLTIVNSGPTGLVGDEAKKEVASRVGIVNQIGMRAMGQVLAPRLFPKEEHAAIREKFVERWAINDPKAYIESLLSMEGWDVVSRIGSINCPTLVLSADQDYTPVALKEAYVKLMPNAELVVIHDSHHATPIEQPESFNTVLKQFLAKHS